MTIKTHAEGKNFYSTSDLSLATVLSIWFSLEEVDKTQNPRKALFIFTHSKDLDNLIDKYWKKELLIEPRQYFDQLKALKARLYSSE